MNPNIQAIVFGPNVRTRDSQPSICVRTFSLFTNTAYTPPKEAIIIIKVPFEVYDKGIIIADPLFHEWLFAIPQGLYALYFTVKPLDEIFQYQLTFVPEKILPEAEIIRATDPYLSRPDVILMDTDTTEWHNR